jgi:hypothetical protein
LDECGRFGDFGSFESVTVIEGSPVLPGSIDMLITIVDERIYVILLSEGED